MGMPLVQKHTIGPAGGPDTADAPACAAAAAAAAADDDGEEESPRARAARPRLQSAVDPSHQILAFVHMREYFFQ